MGTQVQQLDHKNGPQEQNQQQKENQNSPIQSNNCCFFLGDTQTGKKILQFFDGMYYSIFITIITLITLFLDDIRVVFFTTNDDLQFSIINIICMIFFFIEMLAFSFLKQGYFLGYYFWLDLVSTLTMILDLTWVNEILSGGSGVQTAASVAKVARASRASKIGAKATKLIRIIRLIRFLKLYKTASSQLTKQSMKNQGDSKKIMSGNVNNGYGSKQSKMTLANMEASRSPNKRWTKIKQASCHNIGPAHLASTTKIGNLKSTKKIQIRNKEALLRDFKKDVILESSKRLQQSIVKHRHTQNLKDLAGFQKYINDFNKVNTKAQNGSMQQIAGILSTNQIQIPNQTKVGLKLKDQIQKNIITMILMIIISIPLFNAATWNDSITSYQKGIEQLEYVADISQAAFNSQVPFYIDYMQNLPSKLIYFSIKAGLTTYVFPDNYPVQEKKYSISDSKEYRSSDLLAFSTKNDNLVVFQTTAISILTAQLNIGRTLFVCMVLIISTLLFSRDVQVYALQPLQNMFETVKKIAMNPLNAIREIQQKNMCIQALEEQLKQDRLQQTQPNILQNLIVKIGGLLAVGFGQAGTQIISRVIEDPNFVNVIIPGQKVMGIYGFCDIRNFTDATQILQADVMVFVNQIAEICHKVVNGHCGSPNKNIGDAFLLVWKYKETDLKFSQNKDKKVMQLAQTKRVKQFADLAVLSFVRMIAQINKSYSLLKYKNNKALKNRIKNYQGVKMGFGLHVGWSIQGPIGSQYKVDASYLSPSVNMASRLQAGTKQYGVPMLITEDIYNLMTDCKKYLRKVDSVMFAGYDKPTNLYTVDLHIDSLLKNHKIDKSNELSKKQKKYSKVRENIKRNKLLEDIQTKFVTKDLWAHKDIQIMRQRYSRGFFQQWEKGFQAFIKGDWATALTIFNRTKIMAPDQVDGPSQNLIKFIQSNQCKAPSDWKGFRQVDI